MNGTKVLSTVLERKQEAMNKTEKEYHFHLLALQLAGKIVRYDFEPERLRLANNTFYSPDFRVIFPDGSVEFHEVKGYWRDDARVKIKVAAELHPYRFRAVQKAKTGWHYEDF